MNLVHGSPQDWKEYILEKIKIDIQYFLRCNIKHQDLPLTLPKHSMWDETLKIWCKLNYTPDIKGTEQVLNQNLWLNSHIKINKKVVKYTRWIEKGILWISDIMVENDAGELRLMNDTEIAEKLGFRPMFLQYRGLIDAIPNTWKRWLTTNRQHDEVNEEEDDDYKLIDRLMDNPSPSKLIYEMLIKEKRVKPSKAIQWWKENLNIDTEEKKILKSHSDQRKLIKNSKIKSYNYKFLLKNIPYEARLHHMKLKDREECSRCNIKETIIHLYWTCPRSRRLWERLKTLIEENQRTPFPLDKVNCLLGEGLWLSKQSKEVCQTLCILTKYYIHLEKCKENEPDRSIIGLESYLKKTLKLERYIAQENGYHNSYIAKWGGWTRWIDS